MKKLLLIAALMPVLMIGCSKDDKPKKDDQLAEAARHYKILAAESISITNFDGEPLKNAQILIGDALNVPFTGNFVATDDQGLSAIPAGWTAPASITVAADGYIRTTYMNQTPGPIAIKLRPASTKKYQLNGKVTGLPVKDFDGVADFSLVMPALTRSDLLAFDLNTVISPQTDTFTTIGQTLEVPSNISLPTQKEKYSFFTATLDKPVYRAFIGQPGIIRMYALRGNFPFSDVAGDLRGGKSFFNILNKFHIVGGSIRDINIKADQTALDLPGTDLAFTDKRKAFASAIKADETFLAVGVAQQSGYMIPTDIKNLASGQGADLALLPNSQTSFLGVIKKTADLADTTKPGTDRLSAALVGFAAGVQPTMLPMIADPKMSGTGDLLLPAITSVASINPLMTFSVLSQVTESMSGKTKIQNLNRLWEIYAPNWVHQMNIPEWPKDPVIKGTKRWEVSFVGSQIATQPGVGPAIIETATHVTHSSLDF